MPGTPGRRALVFAALLTAVGLPVLAGLYLWLVPAGCDGRGSPGTYRWTCLLPGLIVSVSFVAGLSLPVILIVNRWMGRRLPDGLLPIVVGTGVTTWIVLMGSYALMLDRAYRDLFFWEALTIPQPFLAGALAGLVFWMAVYLKLPAPD